MEKNKKYICAGIFLVVFLGGFIFGKFDTTIRSAVEQKGLVNFVKNEREGDYSNRWIFINPLLDCGELDNVSNKTINVMKEKITNFINEQKTAGVSNVAVYFRDLNNGPWIGINEKEEFNPGSLLKVPMMMRVLKDAETDPTVLQKKVLFKSMDNPPAQYYKPGVVLGGDKAYSVSELISNMIIYSNNDATKAIEQFIGLDRLYKSYEELGIKVPVDGNYSISVRSYGSFFRVLYNASYLSDEFSEQGLKLLAASTFSQGIKAGLPSSTVVAHKFGEKKISSTTKQLHDCGIVYYPNNPYILCVMTRGDKFDKLASVIAGVSKIVYDGVGNPE